MDILLNELSLSGQYASREDFVEQILPSLVAVLDEIAELHKASIYKPKDFYQRKITKTDNLYQLLIGELSRQFPSIRRFKRLLHQLFQEPYWEDNRIHSAQDSYICDDYDTCNHSIAEACERERIIISFKGNSKFSPKQLTILKNQAVEITLDNLYERGDYSIVLKERGIVCTFSLKDATRFLKDRRIVQGQSVYKEIETGNYWYLDNLHKNHYEVFNHLEQHIGVADMNGTLNTTKRQKNRQLSN